MYVYSFIKKIKNIRSFSKDFAWVTAYILEFCTRVPHKAGLKTLEKALNNRTNKDISTY